MLWHFLIAVGGMLSLIALWTAVQFFVRRQLRAMPENCKVAGCGFNDGSQTCLCGAMGRRSGRAGV